jgi:serine/threonine protein kinase
VPITSSAALVDALRQYRLLEPAQVDQVASDLQGRFPEPRDLARELLQRDWLTAYQVNLLLQDRGAELVLGPYLLLERLGEGGMGQVFKARHQLMRRTVALKIIRKEQLAHPAAVQRFHREIRVAATLDHPHVVRAYDAAAVGDAHFLVMEYAEGSDLHRLVQRSGPLPLAQACTYIRQAALGLQHAHERGLVHRDIKPSNLQVTAQGAVVKILDMGLARWQAPASSTAQGTDLTRAYAFMGTADYVAPEQIDDPSHVDARADIYSLGCTFYDLLAGRRPFPDRPWEEKLVSHRKLEPQPIEEIRPEVSPALAAVVRKMMAKPPEDRYATAAMVADALAAFCPITDPVPTGEAQGHPATHERGWTLQVSAPAGTPQGAPANASPALLAEPTILADGSPAAGPDWLKDVEVLEHKGPTPMPESSAEPPAWLEDLRIWVGLELYAANQQAAAAAGTEPNAPAPAQPEQGALPDWLESWAAATLLPEPPQPAPPPPGVPLAKPVSLARPGVMVAPAFPVSMPASTATAPEAGDLLAEKAVQQTGFNPRTGQVLDLARFQQWQLGKADSHSGTSSHSNACLLEVFHTARREIEAWVNDERQRAFILNRTPARVVGIAEVGGLLRKYAEYGPVLKDKLMQHLAFVVETRQRYYRAAGKVEQRE